MPANRDINGKFLPGNNANPSGRPKQNPEAKKILKAAVPDAARALVELLNSKNEKIKLQAAQAILDRTQGKPEIMSKVEVKNLDNPYDLEKLNKEQLQSLEQILLTASNDKFTWIVA